MKKLVVLTLVVLVSACTQDLVTLPDLTPRVLLLEINDSLQDMRLFDLETRVDGLENRLTLAEADIDASEVKIASLCADVALLDAGLIALRDDLNTEVAALQAADAQTRRIIRRRVRALRQQLVAEINARALADANLQSQINSVESDLNQFQAQQTAINFILGIGLVATNVRINQLQSQVAFYLAQINARLTVLESDVAALQADVTAIQAQMVLMQAQLDDVESRLVSVVYPCGAGNSEEVLLQTQDGLVAYFQEMGTETRTFSDTVTVATYTIPAHYHNIGPFNTGFAGEHTIPAQTYNVGDTLTIPVLNKAYLDVLNDGSYATSDGHSCSFTISGGELL